MGTCYSYGHSLDEMMKNIKEAILLCLDEKLDTDDENSALEFVGIQRVEV